MLINKTPGIHFTQHDPPPPPHPTQSFADVTGDLGHEDATVPGTVVVVVVVVVAKDVRTDSEGILLLSFLM